MKNRSFPSGTIYVRGANGDAFNVLRNGNVGIGTINPLAPLHVNGFHMVKAFWDDYLDLHGVSDKPQKDYFEGVSILASHVISAPKLRSYHIFTASDQRIKAVEGKSNNKIDLQILNQLKVTNYQYIDKVREGTTVRKGFIAQEVEEVCPEVISKSADFVPDVYILSEKIIYDALSSELTVCLDKPHLLEERDQVRLIGKNGPKEVEVTQVISDTEFVVSHWEACDIYDNDQVFVFGKKVNDFRTVDYQGLSVIGISAIQELTKLNSDLTTRILALEEKLNTPKSA